MGINNKVRKAAEMGVGVTIITTLLAGCLGGGGDGTPAGVGGVAIPVGGAGNSPFIGVTMKAECANGATGTGVIGTDAAPGDGTITVSGTCTYPVKITATGIGKMRPIGAAADGSEDVVYDPVINLPITNILATSSVPVTANPVTTLVAIQMMSGVNPASSAAVTAALNNAAVVGSAVVAAKQLLVENSLGITPGTLAGLIPDYRNNQIAAASTRIAAVAAIAVQQVATSGTPVTVTSGAKTMGQLVAEKLAATATVAGNMSTASGVAAQLNTATGGAAIDIRADSRVSGNAATTGSIDRDAGKVGEMIGLVTNANGVVGANVAAMLQQISVSSNATVTNNITEHKRAAKQADVLNASAKLVSDANSDLVATNNTENDTRLKVAKAAVAKIASGMQAAMATVGAVTDDVIAQYKLVATGVKTALKNDKDAPTANKVFATPPTAGVAGVTDAMVGKLQGQASGVTAASVATSAALNNLAATQAANALTVARVMAPLAPPPVVGHQVVGAASGVTVTEDDREEYEAAFSAIASKLSHTAVLNASAVQANIEGLKESIGERLSGVSVAASGVSRAAYAQQVAQGTLQQAWGSNAGGFVPPPVTGAVIFTPITTLPSIAPPPTPGAAPSAVSITVTTQAQLTAANAALAAANAAAQAAATQLTAAQNAASAAAAASTTAATSVAPAQTAANAAQAAATAATAARVAAHNAMLAAAAAFPGSAQAHDAAIQASNAAASEAAAVAKNIEAQASLTTVTERLMAAQLAAANTARDTAATQAGIAATQATAAATASASAVAATTAAAATPFKLAAVAAALAAQTAATAAATASTEAAAAGLPAGSSQATAAAASATAAQGSANTAQGWANTAVARVTLLTANEAAATATATTHAATALAQKGIAATQAGLAAGAASSALAATTHAAASPFATTAATAATAAHTAAIAARTAANAAHTAAPTSSQATTAANDATLAEASDAAALISSNTAAARVAALVVVPSAPTAVAATGGNAAATVSFTAPANGGSAITGYTVISNPAGGVDSNAGTTALTHAITGLTNGTAYTFTVTATNAKGTGAASTASAAVTPVAPPAALAIGTASSPAIVFSAPKQAFSTLVTMGPYPVTGVGSNQAVAITPSTNINASTQVQISINGGTYVTSGTVSDGQTISVKIMTGTGEWTAYVGNLSIGATGITKFAACTGLLTGTDTTFFTPPQAAAGVITCQGTPSN